MKNNVSVYVYEYVFISRVINTIELFRNILN